jgi:hypothetical protein
MGFYQRIDNCSRSFAAYPTVDILSNGRDTFQLALAHLRHSEVLENKTIPPLGTNTKTPVKNKGPKYLLSFLWDYKVTILGDSQDLSSGTRQFVSLNLFHLS